MDQNHWYAPGLAHVWLPCAQMKTMRPPLPVVRTHGCRIVLADGRELIDGIASWWTACHGYNHPHIRDAVERQVEAAEATGLRYWATMRFVILPQAVRNMLPSLVTQFIILVKDTSLASIIGYMDLTKAAQTVNQREIRPFEL